MPVIVGTVQTFDRSGTIVRDAPLKRWGDAIRSLNKHRAHSHAFPHLTIEALLIRSSEPAVLEEARFYLSLVSRALGCCKVLPVGVGGAASQSVLQGGDDCIFDYGAPPANACCAQQG